MYSVIVYIKYDLYANHISFLLHAILIISNFVYNIFIVIVGK